MTTTKLSYREQLMHPNWQRKRLEMLECAGWECQNCGDAGTTLHVHHKRYVKGRMAWEYGDDELRVLCEPCHTSEHANRELFERLMAGEIDMSRVIGLVGGFMDCNLSLDHETSEECRTVGQLDFIFGQIASIIESSNLERVAKALAMITDGKSLNPAQELVVNMLCDSFNVDRSKVSA